MGIPSAAHGDEHQHDHHRNGDEAAATVSAATAIVVTAATAGRATKVTVEGRHVLGVARRTLAEITVITVCHGRGSISSQRSVF